MIESVTVVIAASAPHANLAVALASLEPQLDANVDVIVCEAQPSDASLQDRFRWARFVTLVGALVPELWREGIDRSAADIVALTIAQMTPASDWIATIRDEHRRAPVVGGAIEPGAGLRVRDWAEYFCRYARDMLPFAGRDNPELPGDNAAYRRSVLLRNRELYRDGFWEPVVQRKLAADGVLCWHSPALVVRQGRSYGWRAFVRQRLAHGRKYAHQRGEHFSRGRNLVGVFGAPLVPPLMTLRVWREVARRRIRRGRVFVALPVVFSFNVAWACAEAFGHLEMFIRR